MSREATAQSAGMDRQTLRDWVIRYNEQGIEGLHDRWGDGRPTTFTREEQAELMRIVPAGLYPGDERAVRLHARGSGRHIREERFGGRIPGRSAACSSGSASRGKDAAQPSAEGPGRSSGL